MEKGILNVVKSRYIIIFPKKYIPTSFGNLIISSLSFSYFFPFFPVFPFFRERDGQLGLKKGAREMFSFALNDVQKWERHSNATLVCGGCPKNVLLNINAKRNQRTHVCVRVSCKDDNVLTAKY